jgi:hypothetical protein
VEVREEYKLSVFKIKALRKILGPLTAEMGWRLGKTSKLGAS